MLIVANAIVGLYAARNAEAIAGFGSADEAITCESEVILGQPLTCTDMVAPMSVNYETELPEGPELPTGGMLAWPTLQAIMELGGSATIQEIQEAVIKSEELSDDVQQLLRPDGVTTELYHRLSAARTYLRAAGAIERSRRGVWAITEHGRGLSEDDMQGISGIYQRQLAERRNTGEGQEADVGEPATDDEADAQAGAEGEDTWRERLLQALLDLEPAAFERLAMRLLREAGFINPAVTGRPGDGGIDGMGVYRMSLVSFPVFFQCKRYRGSVGAPAVRDFRGAMAGRGDKGLLITTGTFTSEANAEATRPGAPPIDLIDGDRLCDLLKEYGLGISVETVEAVNISVEFFRDV